MDKSFTRSVLRWGKYKAVSFSVQFSLFSLQHKRLWYPASLLWSLETTNINIRRSQRGRAKKSVDVMIVKLRQFKWEKGSTTETLCCYYTQFSD